jgi:hypothetical protein
MRSAAPTRTKGPGVALLAVGVAFLAMAMSTDRSALIGVATVFLVLGAVFLGRSRRAG